MSTTSATGGYLSPANTPSPLQGQALLDFFQAWFVGITGLPGTNVRPRWQPEPGNIPPVSADWIAFGIARRESDVFTAEVHNSSGLGYNETRRHEVLNFLISIYGPNADATAETLREGMQVVQNQEVLNLANMGLIESGDLVTSPELVKDKWYYRVDFTIKVRRQIVLQFAIENIASVNAASNVNNEHYVTNINV